MEISQSEVVEIGSVGKGFDQGVKTLFAHTTGVRHYLFLEPSKMFLCINGMWMHVPISYSCQLYLSNWSPVHLSTTVAVTSLEKTMNLECGGARGFPGRRGVEALLGLSATNETLSALHRAQDSLETGGIKISNASASNPGIPPSSLMSFLRKNSQTSGIVLEDFDTAFINKFYHSHLDDLSNINSSAIVAAASLVARTLYILASDKKNLSASALSAINVNASLVDELLGCLLSCELGLSCELVKDYISPANTCPSNYVGVIVGEPTSTPYTGYVSDVSRFVWNFLAEKTSIPSKNASSSCPQACNNNGELCIKVETDGKGVCVISSTRYVPAYSTRLKFESETWNLLPRNSSEPMDLEDPVWTESNWEMIRLRVYTVQGAAYDHLILLLGIAVTIFAYVLIVVTRAFITKALKLD
ncbi:unnamed protein product [Ilex paraguariensis]